MKKNIIVIISIISLLVISIGSSYAFFFVTNNSTPLETNVTAAMLSNIEFVHGNAVEVPEGGIYPGWIGVQEFNINAPEGMTSGVGAFEIIMETNIDPAYKNWLSVELYKTVIGSNSIVRVPGVISTNPDDVNQLYVNDSLDVEGFIIDDDAIYNQVIDVHTGTVTLDIQNFDLSTWVDTKYYVVYRYNNSDENQNGAMNKSFQTSIKVQAIGQYEAGQEDMIACMNDYNARNITATSEEYFTYTETDHDVTITGYDASGPMDVVIPCGINDKPVSEIGDSAFESLEGDSTFENGDFDLTSVIIGDSVHKIGNRSFLRNKIATLVLGDNVLSVGEFAFQANALTDLVIPNSVTNVDKYAFSQNSIESVNISNSLTVLEEGVFWINSLSGVELPSTLTTIDYAAFHTNAIISFVAPSSLTSIGVSAFSYNKLTSISLNEGLQTIGNSAFVNNAITSFVAPSSLTSIGVSAFSYNKLTSISLNEGLQTIGNSAFANNAITSFVGPSSLTSIGDSAFYNNELTSISLNEGLKTIGMSAFRQNTITSLTIPSSVTSIGDGAFTTNWIPADQAFIYARNSDGSEDTTRVVSYARNAQEVVTIPDGVIYIGDYAFINNVISGLVLPDTVEEIGHLAFAHNRISNLTLSNSLQSIGSGAFTNNLLPDDQAFIYNRNADGSINTSSLNSYGGSNRGTITIPSGVSTIGDYALFWNYNSGVVIPDGVTTIGTNALAYNNFTTVTIPSSVMTIGNYALSNNSLLTSISVEGKSSESDFTAVGTSWNGGVTTTYLGS